MDKSGGTQSVHQYEHPTMEELIKIFPEARNILEDNLLKLKLDLEELKTSGKEKLERRLSEMYLDPIVKDKKTSGELACEFYSAHIESIEKEIRNIEYRLSVWPGSRKKAGSNKITQEDIEQAKKFPITDFVKPNSSGFIKCPFHNERTGSFKVYKEQNRFHCYGCAVGGDVVDFVMKQFDLAFIEAVRMLIKR